MLICFGKFLIFLIFGNFLIFGKFLIFLIFGLFTMQLILVLRDPFAVAQIAAFRRRIDSRDRNSIQILPQI